MSSLSDLLENNKLWAKRVKQQQPDFFEKLSLQQAPEYLWIGCSDSRVPANEIVDLMPGELFVHRNVANIVMPTDLNCLTVIQFAVEVLKVKHIIVCGHYGCGGVRAAMGHEEIGLSDNWLRSIKDVYFANRQFVDDIEDEEQRLNYLCELNVKEQVTHLAHTKIVQHAWQTEQPLTVHGWIYNISDGILQDLNVDVTRMDQVADIYQMKI